MDYPLRVVIQDEPWAVNRVQDTKRLVAQMVNRDFILLVMVGRSDYFVCRLGSGSRCAP